MYQDDANSCHDEVLGRLYIGRYESPLKALNGLPTLSRW